MARLIKVVPHADTFVVPTDALSIVTEELTRHLGSARFRLEPDPGVPGVIGLYRRGSGIGSVLIAGSGLATFTRTLGFMTVFGLVLVATEAVTDSTTRVSVSLIRGADSIADTDRAVDAALAALAQRGVPVVEHARVHAIELPVSSPAHPRTAEALGIQ